MNIQIHQGLTVGWNYQQSWLYKYITSPHPQLLWAARSRNVENVEQLLKRKISPRKVQITLCHVLASKIGSYSVAYPVFQSMTLMLQYCDPKRNNSETLRVALLHSVPKMVDILTPVSDCSAVLRDPEVVRQTLEMHDNCSNPLYAEYFQCVESVAKQVHPNDLLEPMRVALARSANYRALMQAIEDKDLAVMETLINDLPPNINGSAAIKRAAARNRTDMVQRLISVSDPAVLGDQPLRYALINSNDVCVQALLPYVLKHPDQRTTQKTILNAVIESGRTEYVRQVLALYGFEGDTSHSSRYLPCLKFLEDEPLRMAVRRYNRENFDLILAVSDPVLRHDTMMDAVTHNSTKCVAHLIAYTNSHTHTVALYNAVRLNRTQCRDVLLPYGDLTQVMVWINQRQHMFERKVSQESLEFLRNEIRRQQLRKKLEDASTHAPTAPRKRKM